MRPWGWGCWGSMRLPWTRPWLETAASLAEVILHLFHDDEAGAFFQTSSEHERLVARRKDYIDSAVPSGNSLAAELFLRLRKLLDRPVYADHAGEIMHMLADALAEQPAAFGRLLCALDFALNPGYEIAIVGDHQTPDTQALLAEVWRRYLPNSVLALASPGGPKAMALVPFLAGRGEIGGKATGVRLPGLRVQAAGHGSDGPGRPAGRRIAQATPAAIRPRSTRKFSTSSCISSLFCVSRILGTRANRLSLRISPKGTRPSSPVPICS